MSKKAPHLTGVPDSVPPYGNMFFRRRHWNREWQMSFGRLLEELFGMSSAIDFGCGCGYVVEGLMAAGLTLCWD